jgi:hypothetical protein
MTQDPKKIAAILRKHFKDTLLTFEPTEVYHLPTIEIKLKEDKYVNDSHLSFKDTFRPEVLKVLEKQGITGVGFNNTSSTVWWTDK